MNSIAKFSYFDTRQVWLARKKATGDLFAIKTLAKEATCAKNQRQHIRNERNILSVASCDFVVKMYYCFQSEVISLKLMAVSYCS